MRGEKFESNRKKREIELRRTKFSINQDSRVCSSISFQLAFFSGGGGGGYLNYTAYYHTLDL